MTTPVGRRPDTHAAVRAGHADGDRGQRRRVDLAWGASTDNVGVTRLPARTLPGQRLQQLRPDRHPHRHRATTTPAVSRLAPATATASAPPTPPATSSRYSNIAGATTPSTGHARRRPQPGTLTATAVSASEIDLGLGGLHRQRRRHRLPARTLPGRRLHQLRPDRHRHRHELQRHRPRRLHQLQLPRPRHDAAGNLEPLLEHRQRQRPPAAPTGPGRGLRASTRARGRRSPTRRGTATTARSRTATWATTGEVRQGAAVQRHERARQRSPTRPRCTSRAG